MEFDMSKVYTAANADKLKVGSKVIGADTPRILVGDTWLDNSDIRYWEK